MANHAYRVACVRGLVDTDGCIFIHRHKVGGKEYKNLGLTFTSYSRELLDQVAQILEGADIVPHVTKRGRDIYLYSVDAIAKYLEVFGTSNERLKTVYNEWKGG